MAAMGDRADHAAQLRTLLFNDPWRWRILGLVRSLDLPDGWISAGFVRNAVWDWLHGRPAALAAPAALATPAASDVDVLWFDPMHMERSEDTMLEERLRSLDPTVPWSVKNQARMHVRNGDPPYVSCLDAMRGWPETATSVAVRRTAANQCEIAAPFGLDDLFGLVLRPTARFTGDKYDAYRDRIQAKGWSTTWPRLRMEPASNHGAEGRRPAQTNRAIRR